MTNEYTKQSLMNKKKRNNFVFVVDVYKRRPRRPPFRRVLSDGIGVTSSTRKKRNSLEINI
jgi:hypothetical protein